MIGRFFRNAGVIAAAEMLARIKGVIVLPFLTRYLGPLDYGVWIQASMIALLLIPVLSLGMERGLLRMLPGMALNRQYRSFLAWTVITLAGAMICTGLLVALKSPISAAFFSDTDYGAFVILAAATLFSAMLPNAARIWFRIRNDANMLAATTVVQTLISVGAILLAILLKADVYRLILLTLLADFLLGFIFLGLILRREGWLGLDFSIARPAIAFGLPLLPAAYAIWGLNWVGRIFLVHYETLQTVGVYSAVYALGYMIIQIFVNPIWALYPSSVAELHNQGDSEGVDRLLHVTSAGMLILSLPAIAGMWALSEPIIVVIAGEPYRSGAPVVPVIALAYLLLMMASFGDVTLGLAYRQYLATVSIGLAFVVNLALSAVLVPRFGMMGAALSVLGSFFVQFVFSSVMAARSAPFWRSFDSFYRVAAAAVLMALIVKLADSAMQLPDTVRLAIFIPAGAVLYGGLALVFGVVPKPYLRIARLRLSSLLNFPT